MKDDLISALVKYSSTIPLNSPLSSELLQASWAPSETRGWNGWNWIQRQFRGETKPLKHHFGPSEQIRRTSLQLRLRVVVSQ